MSDAFEVVTFSHGDYIVRQGASGDTFYVISEGQVGVTRRVEERNVHVQVQCFYSVEDGNEDGDEDEDNEKKESEEESSHERDKVSNPEPELLSEPETEPDIAHHEVEANGASPKH